MQHLPVGLYDKAELAFAQTKKASGQQDSRMWSGGSAPSGAELAKFRAVDAARPTTERSCTIVIT